jgi:hydrogenase maturation protease
MTRNEEPVDKRGQSVLRPSILILGVGNVLLKDEGIGVHVIEAMRSVTLPENVELFEGGTASIDLLDIIANREKVIIVDAVKDNQDPGTIYRFTPNDVAIEAPSLTSIHQVGLLETLTMTEYLDCAPREVIILGIEPKEIGWGFELSTEVANVMPRVIELVLRELEVGHT